MLEHALDWANRGFKIHPLHPGTKRPVWKEWYDHATNDPERIREIWSERDYNIGVLTDDLIVIDVDVKGGKDGLASLMALDIPLDTLTVRTPSGGLHLYFKNEGQPVANSAGKLGEGLDVRGFHGFVIAPGSRLGDHRYTLDHNGPVRAPGVWAGRLDKPSPRYTNGADVELDDPAAVAHARQWLETRSPAVAGHNGDDHTYRTALKLRDFGLSESVALDVLGEWNERCLPPWSDDELRAKITNAYAYAKALAGTASPQHMFDGVRLQDEPQLSRRWFDDGDAWEGSVEWLYHEMLPTTGVCLLTAPSGAGKTFVALDAANSLAVGRPFFGVSPESIGGTIMCVGEAYGSVKMRLAGLERRGGRLPISLTYVGGLAARGAWAALRTDLMEKKAEIAQRCGTDVRLVILDTLSASGILDDENDNAKAATVLKMFTELSIELNVLFLALHHPPKSGEGERGAGAIRNNADYVMTIKREGVSAVREIEMTKSRDGECKAIGTFTLIPKFLKNDAKGRPIKTMTVSPGEPKIREVKSGAAHAQLVVECVEFAMVSHAVIIDGATWTEGEDAKGYFIDKWPNKNRDRARISEAFKQSVDYAIGFGSLEAMRQDNRLYLKLRRIEM